MQSLKRSRNSEELCIGGFIKWKTGPRIFRLTQCTDSGCGFREISTQQTVDHYVRRNPSDEMLNGIAWIVLPNNPDWEMTAVAYEKQFVLPPRKK